MQIIRYLELIQRMGKQGMLKMILSRKPIEKKWIGTPRNKRKLMYMKIYKEVSLRNRKEGVREEKVEKKECIKIILI